MNSLKSLAAGIGFVLVASAVSAQEWVIDGASSSVAFGSVKKDVAGETHAFTSVSGRVDHEGAATITVSLGSVETNIEVRNERIVEHVFHGMDMASVTGQLDMATIEALGIGEMAPIYVNATLHLMGNDVGFDAPMIAVRLSETRAMVVSDGMAYISTEDMGIDAGIDMLMELASLPSITRTVPITVRLVFDLHE